MTAIACQVEQIAFPTELPVNAFFHRVRSIDFHLHVAFELLLVLSGKIVLYTNDNEQHLNPGDLALVHSGEPHATHDLGDDNLVCALQIDPAVTRHDPHFMQRRFDLAALGVDSSAEAIRSQLRVLAAQIMREQRMKRAAWQMETEALVLRLIALLVRNVPNRVEAKGSNVLLPDETRKLGTRLRSVAEYIRLHASESISISDVAHAVGLSSGYLSRLFHAETGETFGSFITNVRTRRALELLAVANPRPMIDIATACGFPSGKAFNVAFKRIHHCTPSQWREARLARPASTPSWYRLTDETEAVRLLYAFAGGD
jgi:AraC-like DNA-binding protein